MSSSPGAANRWSAWSPQALLNRSTRAPLGSLAISKWTLTEFSGALARLVRMGQLIGERYDQILAELAGDVADSMRVLVPAAEDFDKAAQFIRDAGHNLRPGDALHLAIAHNAGVQLIATLDAELAETAAAFGFSALVSPHTGPLT